MPVVVVVHVLEEAADVDGAAGRDRDRVDEVVDVGVEGRRVAREVDGGEVARGRRRRRS